MSLLIHNALIVDGINEPRIGWLRAEGEFITAKGYGEPDAATKDADEVVDAHGAMLLPGAIDCHVHFREPGMTAKATIASESRAALAGGVTSYIDMPNNVPATTTIDAWHYKMERAAEDSAANYGFMIGATADNLDQLRRADFSQVAAVKVFMGSSTGNMLLSDDSALRAVFADQPGRVVVHAEDQSIIDANIKRYAAEIDPTDISWHSRLRSNLACVAATERALNLAAQYGTRLHVAHVTTREECSFFDPSDSPAGKQITAEVSPHHLLWTSDYYVQLGARIKMNPAIKTSVDRAVLRDALAQGRLDIVATDHAPHLLADKAGDVFHAMSGAPMVQFSLTTMLDLFDPNLVVRRMCLAPAALFGIQRRGSLAIGNYADLVLVEKLETPRTITDDDVISLCGWTPMAGYATGHAVVRTWVNGGRKARPLAFNNR